MLAGNLTDFSITDIFQLFSLTKKSGALCIEADSVGRVYFSKGDVVFAVADAGKLTLGARLVGNGHLSADQVRELAAQVNGGGPAAFAMRLIDSGFVAADVVEKCLREQVNEAVGRMLRLEDGSFTFDNTASVQGWSGPIFDVAELITEAQRQLRAWEDVVAQLPALDVALSLVPTPARPGEVTVTADQWQLLALIDGKRSALQLVELTGNGEFATFKLVAELIEEGLIELRPGEGRTQLEELLAGRRELRALEHDASEAVLTAVTVETVGETEADETATDEPATAPSTHDEESVAGGELPAVLDELETDGSPSDEPPGDDPAGHEPQSDQPSSAQSSATEEHNSDADDEDEGGTGGRAPRRDVNVDRAQMARELASLGFGGEGPARRTVNRSRALTEDNGAIPTADRGQDERSVPDPETMIERSFSRDPSVNRGMLLRLIEGIQGV